MRAPRILAMVAVGAACAPALPPLHVPGPTTAHPDGYSVTSTPVPTAPVRMLARRTASSNVVAFRVVFSAGSSDDPPGKEGLTRLVARTMADGGTESKTHDKLVEALYPLAASITVQVDRDETVFMAEVASSSLETFYPLLTEVLTGPRFDPQDFGRVRAQAMNALTSDLRGADDEALGKETLQALIYEGHPYGHPAVGTERGLASSTLEDVKAQRGRALCRDRMVVGIQGGFPEGFPEKLVHDLAAVPACSAERAPLPLPKKLSGIHVLLVEKPSADSTAISIGYGYDLTRSSPDFPAVDFFVDYLGLHRQSSGRLFQELREKRGLNYGDYAYAEHFEPQDFDRFPAPNVARRQGMFSIWVRPVKRDNALFALHAALHELDTMLTGHISSAEIERYRGFLVKYTALGALTESRRLGYALDDLTYGLSRPYLETMHGAWAGLDEASLAAVVARHIQSKDLVVAIVTKNAAAMAAELTRGEAVKAPVYDAPKPKSVTDADADIVRYRVPVSPDNIRVVSVGDLFRE